jgi:hypothetical protein
MANRKGPQPRKPEEDVGNQEGQVGTAEDRRPEGRGQPEALRSSQGELGKEMAIAETSGADPLAFSAIERALSATADPGAVTFSMPLAFVLATLSTADLLAELGRRANP